MHSRLIRTDQHYSALMFFKWHKQVYGARRAYWYTVQEYGWPEYRRPISYYLSMSDARIRSVRLVPFYRPA